MTIEKANQAEDLLRKIRYNEVCLREIERFKNELKPSVMMSKPLKQNFTMEMRGYNGSYIRDLPISASQVNTFLDSAAKKCKANLVELNILLENL